MAIEIALIYHFSSYIPVDCFLLIGSVVSIIMDTNIAKSKDLHVGA